MELTAELHNVQNLIERDRKERKAHDDKADAHRLKIEARVNEIAESQRALETRVQDIEPMAEVVAGAKARITGGLLVLGFIGSIALTLISVFRDRVNQLFSGGG